MRPTSSAERKTKPSAEVTNPIGWFTNSLKRVGRCVSVIHTRKSPRRASSSGRRSSLGSMGSVHADVPGAVARVGVIRTLFRCFFRPLVTATLRTFPVPASNGERCRQFPLTRLRTFCQTPCAQLAELTDVFSVGSSHPKDHSRHSLLTVGPARLRPGAETNPNNWRER